MIVDLEYIGEVSGIRYGLNANDITRLKDKDKAQVEA